MNIPWRQVKSHVHIIVCTRSRYLLKNISFIPCCLCIIICIFTRPDTETIMMLRCKYHIIRPHLPGLFGPCLCIERSGVKLFVQAIIGIFRHFFPRAYPFGSSGIAFTFPKATGNGIYSPMDELSQSMLTPTFHICIGTVTYSMSSMLQGNGCPSCLCLCPKGH